MTGTRGPNKLYHLDDNNMLAIQQTNNKTCKVTDTSQQEAAENKRDLHGSAPTRRKAATVSLNPLEVLHLQLGHAGEKYIKHLIKHNMVKGATYRYEDIKDLTLHICDACVKGKSKRFPVPCATHIRELGPIEWIAVDTIGPFRVQSMN